jgi:predicted nucleotidyltransferase
MAPKANIIEIVKKFCKMVSGDRAIAISKVYLFGSNANGTADKNSDIDVAIVSKSFTGCKYSDREIVNPYVLKIDSSIEVHPFTVAEFNRANPFAKEIIRNGKKIL